MSIGQWMCLSTIKNSSIYVDGINFIWVIGYISNQDGQLDIRSLKLRVSVVSVL